MKSVTSEPIIKLKDEEFSELAVNSLPDYTLKELSLDLNTFSYYFYRGLIEFIKIIVRIRLRVLNYKTYSNELKQEEVEHVYTREAKTYEWKHHLTTNFRDTWWRRLLAFDVLAYSQNLEHNQEIKVIDLGTGIGLSIEEMFRVFSLEKIRITAYGIDYNEAMLQEARNLVGKRLKEEELTNDKKKVIFLRGDGRNLTGDFGKEESFTYFPYKSIDCITIMCGVGGIHLPYQSFREQLCVLKDDGITTIIDIHKPIPQLESRWPWPLKYFDYKVLEQLAWQRGTIPLVLRKVWGWQDPTPIFYIAPLVTYYSEKEKAYFGFNIVSFSYQSESWWLRLPIMNTAKLTMKKVTISALDYKKRRELFTAITGIKI